jgi:hypothetical protein
MLVVLQSSVGGGMGIFLQHHMSLYNVHVKYLSYKKYWYHHKFRPKLHMFQKGDNFHICGKVSSNMFNSRQEDDKFSLRYSK